MSKARGSLMYNHGFRTRRFRMEELEHRRVLATLAIPSTTPGELDFPLSADTFEFQAEAGTLYSFSANPVTLENPAIKVVDPEVGIRGFATEREILWLAPSDGPFLLQVNDADFANALHDLSPDDYRYSITSQVIEYADDHGSALSSATDLVIPAAIQGQIEVASDVDYFRISGISDLIEVADVSQLADVEIVIRDENGLAIEAVPGLTNRWNLATDDDFFVEVGGRDNATAEYTVDLTAVDHIDDFGNGPAFATSINLPGSISGALETEGDVDVFSFEASAGATYDIANEVTLRIFTEDGTLSDTLLPNGFLANRWTAPQDGVYFVEVASFRPGDYVIGIATISPDDHGNTASTATPITTSTTVNAFFEDRLDTDFFSFEATGGSNFRITASPGLFDGYQVEVIDSDQTRSLASISVSRFAKDTIWTAPSDGIFYVRVTESSSMGIGERAYTFGIEPSTDANDDHGDDVESATLIDVPSTTSGSFESNFDSDYFSFEATEGTIYRVDVDHPSARTTLRSVDNRSLAFAFSFQTLFWSAPADGTYFIETLALPGDGNYEITLEALEFDDDYGNTRSVATEISVPSTSVGSIEVNGDIDVFSFQATAGVRYAINTTGQVDHIETELSDLNVIERGDSIDWIAPADGVYFVDIDVPNHRDSTGEYSLTIEESPYEDDHPNTFGLVAETSELPITLTGSIEVVGDVDYFRFEAIENTLYGLAVEPAGENGVGAPKVEVYDADGSRITRGRSLDKWIAPSSGTYFVRVGNSELASSRSVMVGSYELTVEAVTYADDHGNAVAMATPVVGTQAISGIAEVDGDADYFSFTPTAFERYEFTAVGESDVVLGLEDSASRSGFGLDDDAHISTLNWTAIDGNPFHLILRDKPDGEFGAYNIAFESFVAGDLNKDDIVDSADLGLLLNSFGDRAPSFPRWEDGDLNGDRLVNSTDLGLLLNNFGNVRESANDGGEATAATVEKVNANVKTTKASVAIDRYSPANPKSSVAPVAVRDFVFGLDEEEDS